MVLILPPPPLKPPHPDITDIETGDILYRIYDPSKYYQTPISFKRYGPNARFDHHRHPPKAPAIDPERGIYYAGATFSGCIAEYFGDMGSIACGTRHLAKVRINRKLKLLSLCDDGAMQAGTVSAISKADHLIAQSWSRYFYEDVIYQYPDGIKYFNAHNDEIAYALFERAESAVELVEDKSLNDSSLLPSLAYVANRLNLDIIL